MAYPGHHSDASEGFGSYFGFSETRQGLTKAVGGNYAATVEAILKNTKSGPGKQIYDFKQMLKTIKENLNNKMEETGKMNGKFIESALEDLMREAMPIIEAANTQIMNIKPKPITVNTEAGESSNDDFGDSQPDLNEAVNPSVTAESEDERTLAPGNNTQAPGRGLFMMRVPKASLGGPKQMPMHYCVVHANAHGFGGAQEPFSNAACGPWQSGLCGVQQGDYAQPPVFYVMTR